MTALTHEHMVALQDWLNNDGRVQEAILESTERAIDELGLPLDYDQQYAVEIAVTRVASYDEL